jgi:FdhD protein
MPDLRVAPDPADPRLTRRVSGRDHTGAAVETSVTVERPLTLYLNGREIVTMMTILDRPEDLAVGYLLNQGMLRAADVIEDVQYDDDLGVVVVRTPHRTDFEEKLTKKTLTSGCAQGTAFGDLMEGFSEIRLDPDARLSTGGLYRLLHRINTIPSLYLEAGAIHGCALAEGEHPLCYMEDVGRHNAVDKIAGWMHRERVRGSVFYTTGRLTSEMVIKTVRMGLPILVSRSGFTAWGVELAREANLTLIGRCKGKRFTVLAGEERLIWDADAHYVEEESARHWRKNADAS